MFSRNEMYIPPMSDSSLAVTAFKSVELLRNILRLFCVAIVISEPFFAGAYFRSDFAAIGRNKVCVSIFLV